MYTIDVHKEALIARKYNKKMNRCKDSGREFNISLVSYRNIFMAKKCKLTGTTLTQQTSGQQKPTDVTIDRLDSNIGYVKNNVVACSHAANVLKALFESKRTLTSLEQAVKLINTSDDPTLIHAIKYWAKEAEEFNFDVSWIGAFNIKHIRKFGRVLAKELNIR